MGPIEIGFIGISVLLLLLALRTPIGVALGLVSFFGIWGLTSSSAAWGILSAVPFNFIGNWSLSAIPMFLLMGYIASHTGLTEGLFRFLRSFLEIVPGGLAVASVWTCAMFAAASGSSVATAAAMSRIAVPEMLRYRYDQGLACGAVSAAGTLGSLIPPSILLVLYGIFTQVSIAKLFMAGFVPGLISALVLSALIVIRVSIRPNLAPRINVQPYLPIWQRLTSARDIWPLPLLVLGVLGGIFSGLITPTEAGALGAMMALIIGAVRRSLSLGRLRKAFVDTVVSSTVIFVIGIGAVLFTRFMALSGLPDYLANSLLGEGNQFVVLLQISILYLLLGMFVDPIGMLLLTLPIVVPIAESSGINLIWFGIIVIKLLEIGLITPPVGLNVYVIKSTLGESVSLSTIFRGVAWFVIAELLVLFIIILFPNLSLWLPSILA